MSEGCSFGLSPSYPNFPRDPKGYRGMRADHPKWVGRGEDAGGMTNEAQVRCGEGVFDWFTGAPSDGQGNLGGEGVELVAGSMGAAFPERCGDQRGRFHGKGPMW